MIEQGVIRESSDEPVEARCLRCDYSLRGLLTNACPECGQAFDPTQPWTMRLPGARRAGEMGVLRPVGWNYRTLRWLLVAVAAGSAWFVAPHPTPTLVLALLWLLYALPYLRRGAVRQRLFRENPGLPPGLSQVDEPDIRRLRRYFVVALLVVATQTPFGLAYAISYPFMEPTVRYWWVDVPADRRPPDDLIVRGVLVGRLSAGPGLYISFVTPTGTITFRPGGGTDRLVGHWQPRW
jgi:hypothetical protein